VERLSLPANGAVFRIVRHVEFCPLQPEALQVFIGSKSRNAPNNGCCDATIRGL
jgi:hypothetical protein